MDTTQFTLVLKPPPPKKKLHSITAPQRVPGLSYPRELQPGTNNWGRRWPGAPWQPVVELW